MIVKNEEKYLGMCLESLKPVLDAIDSELIIADTGSVDKTVETAKKFTNNVYYFEWCNDYSKARNTTLRRAKGEWYMFVDADEILQNPEELIHFFSSGEYKKFDGATIVIRNQGETYYSDFNALRLSKRTMNLKFYYPIHEAIYPVGDARKNINAVFLHYGYVTGRAHTKKNIKYIKTIKEYVDKYPEDVRLLMHLADAYGAAADNYHALKYALLAAKMCDDDDYTGRILYEKAIRTCFNAHDYINMEKTAEKYFKRYKKKSVVDLNIYNYIFKGYYRIENYDKAIKAGEKFMKLRSEIVQGHFTSPEISSMTLEISDANYILNQVMMSVSYLNTGNINKAENIINGLYKTDIRNNADLNNLITCAYNIYLKTKSEDVIINVYDYIRAADRTELIYKYFTDFDFSKKAAVWDVFRIFAENTGQASDDKTITVFCVYYLDHSGKTGEITELLKNMSGAGVFHELIYFFIKYGIPISDGIKKDICVTGIDLRIIRKYDDCCDHFIKEAEKTDDILFRAVLCESIFEMHGNASDEIIKRTAGIYYDAVSCFMGAFNNDVLEEFPDTADRITRFRHMYMQLYDSMKEENLKKTDEIKNKIYSSFPAYGKVMDRIIKINKREEDIL
ncbi:MAG: glycosyltransferase [Oscillospiraceae bacterium]|nr:glycosyltransferase [Oscillospiraceae bacterium]